MEEAIIIIAVICVIVWGYFAMARVDKYLNESRKSIEKESEKREPSCVFLIEKLTDEELVEEINRFRKKHGDARIMLYDNDGNKEENEMETPTELNG